MKENLKLFFNHWLLYSIIAVITILSHYIIAIKVKAPDPVEIQTEEDVIFQYDTNYMDCLQLSKFEIYCLIKDIRKV